MNSLNNIAIEFATPAYFVLLIVVPLLLLLYYYAFWRKKQALAAFAQHPIAAQLVVGFSQQRRWLKVLCLLLAVTCLVLALTQPKWGLSKDDVGRQGRDLIIMLDVSLSMLAEDVSPNRLEHAKAGIRELVETVRDAGGHRLGLITFAGRASLQCPLTLDYNFFLQRLAAADTETVARKGTLLGDAIRQALQGFGALEFAYTDLIIITDGEDHGSFPIQAAKIAKAQQVNLYIVGIGDDDQGALVPVKNPAGEREYLQYDDHDVRSRLRQSLLLELARVSNGAYQPAGLGPIQLLQLYDDYIADKETRPIDNSSAERAAHRFQWFVLLAVLFLLLEMLLRERVRE